MRPVAPKAAQRWSSVGRAQIGRLEALGALGHPHPVLAPDCLLAVTAWTQLGHDDELSRAYAVALQELLLIAGAAERATTDGALAAVVRDGEEAIGRENRVWVAKRAERFKAPDLGAAD